MVQSVRLARGKPPVARRRLVLGPFRSIGEAVAGWEAEVAAKQAEIVLLTLLLATDSTASSAAQQASVLLDAGSEHVEELTTYARPMENRAEVRERVKKLRAAVSEVRRRLRVAETLGEITSHSCGCPPPKTSQPLSEAQLVEAAKLSVMARGVDAVLMQAGLTMAQKGRDRRPPRRREKR